MGQYLKERAAAEHMVARIKAGSNVTKGDIEQLAAEFREPLTKLMEQTQTTTEEIRQRKKASGTPRESRQIGCRKL